MDAQTWALMPIIVFGSLWLFTTLVTIIAIRIVIRMVRRLVAGSQAFSDDSRDRFFGFIVAGILSWKVVPWVGWLLIRTIWFLTRDLPIALSRAYDVSTLECDKKDAVISVCRRTLTMAYVNYWTDALLDWLRSLSGIPYFGILIFLLLWAITTQIFGAFREPDPEKRGVLARPFVQMNDVARQNALFFVILGIATYLSIASIAAIPGLAAEDRIAEAAKPERLKETLEKTMPSKVDFSKVKVEQPFKVAATSLEDLKKPLPALPPAPAGAPSPAAAATDTAPPATSSPQQPAVKPLTPQERQEVHAVLTDRMDEAVVLRGRVVAQLENTEAGIRQSVEAARAEAQIKYEQNLEVRKGARERAEHFEKLVNWFRRGSQRGAATIRQCSEAILAGDDAARDWSSDVERLLRTNPFGDWWRDAAYGARMRLIFDHYYRATAECDSRSPFDEVPVRSALGGNLGPFRLVARWLLETESLALTLIVGLIGFGLLGSASTTFIREQAGHKRQSGTPLVSDLGGVVIRGVSAAIVVFLAVKGGLAIFAGTDTEPNPYVLLLTCLIAAVFSEIVWEWARNKLTENLRGGAPPAQPPRTPGPPPPPLPPPAAPSPPQRPGP